MIFHLIQAASGLPANASALESSISALETATSALEREIAALDSSSVPWERSLPWLAGVVAFGVALELWLVWSERHDEWEAWALTFFGVLRRPDKPSTLKFAVELASVLLITLGIVGELAVGIKIASINGVLRGKSAELRSKSSILRSESDQLIALVNNETVALKQQMADRHITVPQRQEMLQILRPQAGAGVLVQFLTPSGTDAPGYAAEIEEVFHDAGWKVTQPTGALDS